ncbi:G2/mitotic-specific cyclin-B1 isoform X2 [Cygnus olor]|uniref:G2/mitotic-specific cyclin-B1 isoform X2 n=1 Tax=Cygnus olor TaxID=8869 RepID=UPI001ADE1ABE|nr:G2/mitotic-specific cyclin-B1 isoform X2 [Cygnus olor]
MSSRVSAFSRIPSRVPLPDKSPCPAARHCNRPAPGGPGKSSARAAKTGVEGRKPGLLPRTVLRDIGNRIAEPPRLAAPRKLLGAYGKRPGAAGTAAAAAQPVPKPTVPRRPPKAAAKKSAPPPPSPPPPSPPPPPPEPQPQQEPTSSSSTEEPVCTPAEGMLCQAVPDALLEVEDVDAKDSNKPELCSEYVKDIYKYLRELEATQAVRPKYLAGRNVTAKMRAMLIDWLVQVQVRFSLLQETLYLTVSIIDLYLQDNAARNMLQLVGITAMFLASKYEETFPPSIGDFAYVTQHKYTTSQICKMEMKILQALDFHLGRPLPIHFLKRTSKIAEVDLEQHILSKYLLELSIMDYDIVHIPPSRKAAAATCLALKLLGGSPWTATLQYYMSYSESDLVPVMQHLAKNVILVNQGYTKYAAIKNKYASSGNKQVSALAQLNSAIIEDLAKPVAELL